MKEEGTGEEEDRDKKEDGKGKDGKKMKEELRSK